MHGKTRTSTRPGLLFYNPRHGKFSNSQGSRNFLILVEAWPHQLKRRLIEQPRCHVTVDSLIVFAQELSYHSRGRECGSRNGRPVGDRPAEQGYLGETVICMNGFDLMQSCCMPIPRHYFWQYSQTSQRLQLAETA